MPNLTLTAHAGFDTAIFPWRVEENRAPRVRRMSESSHSVPVPADAERHAIDARLLQRAAAGEQAALGELYDRWHRPLYALAFRVLNDASEAEDIIHDVFVTLWQKSSGFEPTRGNAFAWAATLTRNRAIDRLRSRARRAQLLDQSIPSDLGYDETNGSANGGDSAGNLWVKEKATAVRRALANLPGEQRDALNLAYFSGLTQQEIAAKLSQPLGTVKARIRRGLLKLRDTLAPQL